MLHLFGEHFGQDWCEEDGYGPNNQEWVKYSWDHFCKVVMHERRVFFLGNDRDQDDPKVYSPRQVLRAIFDYARRMGLFKKIPPSTRLLRARWGGCETHLETPEELGLPPAEGSLRICADTSSYRVSSGSSNMGEFSCRSNQVFQLGPSRTCVVCTLCELKQRRFHAGKSMVRRRLAQVNGNHTRGSMNSGYRS